MSLSVTEHTYWLRSRSSEKQQSLSTSSPTSPPPSPSPVPSPKESTPISRNTRHRRKRRFHQLNEHLNIDNNSDDNEDIDLNITTNNLESHHRNRKKAKLSRTIKFTLQAAPHPTSDNNNNNNKTAHTHEHKPQRKIKRIRLTFKNKRNTNNTNNNHNKQNLETVLSREASLSAKSPIVTNKRKRLPRIEEYEVPTSHRITRRNPFVCCYEFFNGYRIGIVATLGSATDVKAAIKILSQELVSGRAKASIQTQKNSFLVYIKTRKGTLIGCSILHIDHVWKRVNIEMFAVDQNWRGNGFASCMVFLIQYRMLYLAKYDLFVCAAKSAVPFWSNAKYKFVYAHKGILEQHEVADEKHGGTKHLIWYGTPAQARCNLLQYFVQSQ
eukprot:448901_1